MPSDLLARPERVGPYRILQLIGEGGMGEVYLAEQEHPVRRRVALKMIKPGMDTKQVVSRFEMERQALAVMDHPNIARVYDGGATETGRPYFVMELVRGMPITSYCDKNRLTTRERLLLFAETCDAVQHAHQKGVIHRDLKPTNILVTLRDGTPTPKIIDFGIARAIDHRLSHCTLCTDRGEIIGTPEYMSPEQAEMSGLDIDTRSDIYSLGIVLYELLAGALPFDPVKLRTCGLEELLRVIREEMPPRLSSRFAALGAGKDTVAERRSCDPGALLRQLAGDLEWIVLKALEKDRTRRYETASALGLDIRRHLHNEPILARPPRAAYKLRKLVARHKAGFAFACSILVLVTLAAVSLAVQSARIAAERNRAIREADKAKAVNKFMQETLGSANPLEGRDRDITVLETLHGAADRIDATFASQPAIASELEYTIGVTYLRLGHYAEAERLLRSSVRIREALGGPDDPDLTDPLSALGIVRHEQGDYGEAEACYRHALDLARRKYGPDHPETVSVLSDLALLMQDMGQLREAEPLLRRILEVDRGVLGDDDVNVAMDLNNLGRLLDARGRSAEAEPLLREAVSIMRRKHNASLSFALGNLGELLTNRRDFEGAERVFEEAVPLGLREFGERSQDVAKVRAKYGICLLKERKYREAEPHLQAAYSVFLATLGDRNDRTVETARSLLELYRAWGREEDAAPYLATASGARGGSASLP